MAKYELTSKQISLITESLSNYAMWYECESQEYENTIHKDGRDICNLLIEQHNKQESENLKHYINYVFNETDMEEV